MIEDKNTRAFRKFFKAHTGFPKFKSRKNLKCYHNAGTIRKILRITLLYGGRDTEA